MDARQRYNSNMSSTDKRIILLDGGMGTTLEALGHDVGSRLWGADLIEKNPAAIREVHKGFLDAGAQLIGTSTYQTSEPLVMSTRDDSSPESARALMQSIVAEAHSVCSGCAASSEVCLSLGPYGAQLSPGQEYKGLYPPPFGPRGFDQEAEEKNTNAFAAGEEEKAMQAEDALLRFHLDRLRVFTSDEETWNKVGWIAFETVPVRREIRAIRRAMAKINAELQTKASGKSTEKPFWISCVFPGGSHPDETISSLPVQEQVATLVQDLLAPLATEAAQPTAIGLNCTSPSYLPVLSSAFASSVVKLDKAINKPWFIMYPDGGLIYDVVTRTWSPSESAGAESWAKQVAVVAKDVEAATDGSGEKVWKGVLVGGCCKAGFEEIAALKMELDV